jgi:nicotinate dehydrogenase subunit A
MIEFRLNGSDVVADVDDGVPLLYVLRNDFGLNGPKFGCGLGQCGACTILLDGSPVRSCLTPVTAAAGRELRTQESLGDAGKPHPLQQAILSEQALQCGYCANGVLMSAAALLERNPEPTDREIRAALDGNLCRCGAQPRIIKAVKRAARSAP